MANVETPAAAPTSARLNVADRLAASARANPGGIAVVCPRRWSPTYRQIRMGSSGTTYSTTTFAELDADVSRIARGLIEWGVPTGSRIALLVRPGIEFVTLVFGLLRAGMVIVLVDPGLGRHNLIRCLADAGPDGFIAISRAHAVRQLLRRKFSKAKWNVTHGRRWFWGGITLRQLREMDRGTRSVPATLADDAAAVIFTSGSTGPPKGVLYTQRMFDVQVESIQTNFGLTPGGADLGCFPLFALFNAAMGVTTVLPEMDFSRPASADPKKLLAAANDWQITQSFASPAVWKRLSEHCAQTGEHIKSLRKVFSCGAPVPAVTQAAVLACIGQEARMYTPYGATECLPISSIESAEVLEHTALRTSEGAGVCVGRMLESVNSRVIRISDEPIEQLDDTEELGVGEIGELIVTGPQVSLEYVTRPESNSASKILDSTLRFSDTWTQSKFGAPQSGDPVWHRTGDVGYFDAEGRFWYCGRKAHRVITSSSTLYTECVEAIYNRHPDVVRTALVGVGDQGRHVPVVFFEPKSMSRRLEREMARELFDLGQQFEPSRAIAHFVKLDKLPVDVRHNAKILREELAERAKALKLQSIAVATPSA
jgi:acyl-CoA synthetase (AMP-forming)/AMP-acid ligase II